MPFSDFKFEISAKNHPYTPLLLRSNMRCRGEANWCKNLNRARDYELNTYDTCHFRLPFLSRVSAPRRRGLWPRPWWRWKATLLYLCDITERCQSRVFWGCESMLNGREMAILEDTHTEAIMRTVSSGLLLLRTNEHVLEQCIHRVSAQTSVLAW